MYLQFESQVRNRAVCLHYRATFFSPQYRILSCSCAIPLLATAKYVSDKRNINCIYARYTFSVSHMIFEVKEPEVLELLCCAYIS
jgi:hypothetical protein